MELKYIMLEQQVKGMKRHVPIFFFESLTHLGVWEMAQMSEETSHMKLVSAGFVTFYSVMPIVCHGESTSLKEKGLPHKPLESDAATIATYKYVHGVLS